MRPRISIFLSSICAALLLGCESKKVDPEYEQQLRAFAAAYHGFLDSHRVSPTNLGDLKSSWGSFKQVAEDIVSGQFIVVWGAALENTASANDKYALGYEVDVPERGGTVLLGGGTVRYVSAEEFGRLGQFKLQGKRVE
jgi:hypothetical protein